MNIEDIIKLYEKEDTVESRSILELLRKNDDSINISISAEITVDKYDDSNLPNRIL